MQHLFLKLNSWMLNSLCYNLCSDNYKNSPFSREEIENLKEEFDVYIKTVLDIQKNLLCGSK